jgi:hypothetical protein
MRLKAGLAALALVALWAMTAAASPAAASGLAAERYSSELSSEQLEEVSFGSEGGTVKCKKTTFSGSLSGAAGTTSLAPVFSECTAFGTSATIAVNGCQYVLHPGAETGSGVFTGSADLSCAKEKSIVIATAFCEVKIGSQTGLKSTTLTNETGSPRKVVLGLGITGITYNVTVDGFLCPFNGTGVRTNGTMSGKVRLKATAAAAPVGLFVLVEAAVACKVEGEECPAGQDLGLPIKIKATSPDAKIELDSGFTITCENTSMELEVAGHLPNQNFAVVGREWEFKTKKCETGGGLACNPVASEKTFFTEIKPTKGGDADWIGTLLRLRITCGAQINCRYQTAKAAIPLKGGNPALLEAKGTGVAKEAIEFEVNCGTEAKITTTLSVNSPDPLFVMPGKMK